MLFSKILDHALHNVARLLLNTFVKGTPQVLLLMLGC